MIETIETGLVYIHRLSPTKKFIGCGVLIEGPYIATCRHVWRDATNAGADEEVEIEYPRFYQNGRTVTARARLVDPCEGTDGPPPDLVLLEPTFIPSGVMTLQLAANEHHETGPGYAHARLVRVDSNGRDVYEAANVTGSISPNQPTPGRRQFTGDDIPGYWFSPGSSGSLVFVDRGQQLAGILSLSELGWNEG